MILFFGSKKLLTDFYNVSGTHGDQHVALGKIFVQIVFDFRKGWEIFAGSAEFYNALLDIFGGDAERIGFSGCVNIGENHYPGYRFKMIDGLITNFHLPESTLVMLVSALAGKEHIMAAYEEAVREKYRFFSFGDAMMIE